MNVVVGGKDEKIIMSSLDDIDHAEDELGDHSSEDSGTGCRRAGMLGSGRATHAAGSSPTNSPGGSSGAHSSLGRQHGDWERGLLLDEIGGVFIDRSTGDVIGVVSAERAAAEGRAALEGERVGMEVGGMCEESTANDRDSGHGSEAKSHSGIVQVAGDSAALVLGANYDVPASLTPGDEHLLEEAEESLPLPPPPPPPLSPSSPTQSSSSTSSSQQLPCSSSRNLSNNSRPQTESDQHPPPHSQHRQQPQWAHPRAARHPISHTDLPPPPPPPPLSAATLPLPQAPLAAATATAELNSSSNDMPGGQQQWLNDSGSISSTQLESKTAVAFSPQRPPPNPPHIA